jgi:hypothetical protein
MAAKSASLCGPRTRITVDPDINTEDVRSTTDTENVRYDSQFKLGSYFLIGRCLFVVVERSSYIFEPGISGRVNVYLECVETWSRIQNKIGLVGINKVEKEDFLIGPDISEAFFPICQVELANIVNNKDCDVTELGLRSNVWLRFDGICNFNAIPTPDQLINRNNKKIQLSTSFRSTYGARASYFLLYVRPANEDPDGSAKWEFLKMFCVRGSSPVDQYNFIRIFHPTIINKDAWSLKEMIDRPSRFGESTTVTIKGTSEQPRSVSYIGMVRYGTNTDADSFKESNVWSIKAGLDPYFNNLGNGATHTFDIVYTDEGQGFNNNREVTLRVRLRSEKESRANVDRNLWWRVDRIDVVTGSGRWRDGDTFRKRRFFDGFGDEWEIIMRVGGLKEETIQVPTTIGRKFEEYPGIAEVSHYGDLIQARSCDDASRA